MAVHVLMIASQKGGSGKTTLARNLAVAAPVRCAVADTDPQGSLTDWWNRRQAENPILVSLGDDPGATIPAIAAAGVELLIVDTPPRAHAWMERLLGHADMVLVPVRPSPDDLAAVGSTLDLIGGAGRPFAFVVNAAKAGTRLTRETPPELEKVGAVAPVMIHDRQEYPTAASLGRGVTESVGPGALEMTQLLHYVMAEMRKARGDAMTPVPQAVSA